MQCPRRADPAQRRQDNQGDDVEWREVREDCIRLGALDGLHGPLEQVLGIVSYVCPCEALEATDFHLRVGVDLAKLVGQQGDEHGDQ